MSLVKFYSGLSSAFNAGSAEANSLYFLTDTKQLYKGSVLYADISQQEELATKLDKSASEIIMKLMKMGTMATINQEISFEIGSLVASEYGFELVEGSANDEEELEGGDVRTVFRFHPVLAPVKIGVLPLSKKLNKEAEEVFAQLSKKYNCEFDDRGTIGKRYRRQDEIGTPYCVTFDFDSLEDGCVTVRDRDTMAQERIAIADLDAYFADKFTF